MAQARKSAEISFCFPEGLRQEPSVASLSLSLKSLQAADWHADVLYVGRCKLAREGPQTDSKMGEKKRMLNILIQEIPWPTTSLVSSLLPTKVCLLKFRLICHVC